MSSRKDILFLYDIDGTLVKLDEISRQAYSQALLKVLGKSVSLEEVDWTGATDTEVISRVIRNCGFVGKQLYKKLHMVFRVAPLFFEELIRTTPNIARMLPYAYEISEWTYRNYYNCLLTGNIRKVAYMKLSLFGLDKFFPVGAFGNERKNRNKLVPIAVKRAENYYKTKFRDFIIVGDSYRDIFTARANNIKSVIVTTGKTSREQLQKFTPDFIVDSLSELPSIVLSL